MDTKEKGSLIIETSMSLTVFMLFILFIISFAKVYKTQNIINNAVNQTAISLSRDSIFRETMSGSSLGDLAIAEKLINQLCGNQNAGGALESFRSFSDLGEDKVSQIMKDTFEYHISETEAEKTLKKLGLVNGMSDIDFSESIVGKDYIKIKAKYKMEIPFLFLGNKQLNMQKEVNIKMWKSTKKEIQVG